jgi:hypothetical protein
MDEYNEQQTTNTTIMNTFLQFLQKKYNPIVIDRHEVDKMSKSILNKVTQETNDTLEAVITIEEVEEAVRKGKNRKAPGSDGIVQEVYKHNWAVMKLELLDILRQMHAKGGVDQKQKHGIMVCLPKTPQPTKPEDHRA